MFQLGGDKIINLYTVTLLDVTEETLVLQQRLWE